MSDIGEYTEREPIDGCCLTAFYDMAANILALARVTVPNKNDEEEFVIIDMALRGLDKNLKKVYACGLPSLYDNSEELRRNRWGAEPYPNKEEFEKMGDLPSVMDKIRDSGKRINEKIKAHHASNYPKQTHTWDELRSVTAPDKAEINKWVSRLHYMLERNMELMCRQ